MFDRLRWLKNLFLDLPRQLRLAYCLVRDPRVPIGPKAGVLAAVGLAINPVIDLPELIPLVGELDALAVSMLALRVFIALCPAEVVAEQERLIAEHRSRFDDDVRAGERVALFIWRRLRPRLERDAEVSWADGPGTGIELEGAGVARVRRGAVA
ncbi:MAG: YkvA family protein [Candidatus Dormibacteria bacterium]